MPSLEQLVDVLKKTEDFFRRAGLETPKPDAEWLLAEVLGCKRLELYLQWDRPLEPGILDRLRPMVKRRAAGEPLQYIIGYSDFHDTRLKVAPGVLIPRPETEQLVELVIDGLKAVEAPRIVDLGTGTGAIALALAGALPGARVLAVDQSAEALRLARENAEALGLRGTVAFRSGNWLEGLDLQADCIVSNPPYLTLEEWKQARAEVREHEPRKALVAEDAGMADLKRIIDAAGTQLVPGGLLALEMGIAHGGPLSAHAAGAGYRDIVVKNDDSRRPRFLLARKA